MLGAVSTRTLTQPEASGRQNRSTAVPGGALGQVINPSPGGPGLGALSSEWQEGTHVQTPETGGRLAGSTVNRSESCINFTLGQVRSIVRLRGIDAPSNQQQRCGDPSAAR